MVVDVWAEAVELVTEARSGADQVGDPPRPSGAAGRGAGGADPDRRCAPQGAVSAPHMGASCRAVTLTAAVAVDRSADGSTAAPPPRPDGPGLGRPCTELDDRSAGTDAAPEDLVPQPQPEQPAAALRLAADVIAVGGDQHRFGQDEADPAAGRSATAGSQQEQGGAVGVAPLLAGPRVRQRADVAALRAVRPLEIAEEGVATTTPGRHGSASGQHRSSRRTSATTTFRPASGASHPAVCPQRHAHQAQGEPGHRDRRRIEVGAVEAVGD